jgi:SAM-dependent methyltransferase
LVRNLLEELPAQSFDYVVGTAILCHRLYPQNLRTIYRLLKPGGRILFFEVNYWNPQVAVKTLLPTVGRWAGNATCQDSERTAQTFDHQGQLTGGGGPAACQGDCGSLG